MSVSKSVGPPTIVATVVTVEIAMSEAEDMATVEAEEVVVVVAAVMVEDTTMFNHQIQALEVPLLRELAQQERTMLLNMLSTMAVRIHMQLTEDTRTTLPCTISTISNKVQMHNPQLLDQLSPQHFPEHLEHRQFLNQHLHRRQAMLNRLHLRHPVALPEPTMR